LRTQTVARTFEATIGNALEKVILLRRIEVLEYLAMFSVRDGIEGLQGRAIGFAIGRQYVEAPAIAGIGMELCVDSRGELDVSFGILRNHAREHGAEYLERRCVEGDRSVRVVVRIRPREKRFARLRTDAVRCDQRAIRDLGDVIGDRARNVFGAFHR